MDVDVGMKGLTLGRIQHRVSQPSREHERLVECANLILGYVALIFVWVGSGWCLSDLMCEANEIGTREGVPTLSDCVSAWKIYKRVKSSEQGKPSRQAADCAFVEISG